MQSHDIRFVRQEHILQSKAQSDKRGEDAVSERPFRVRGLFLLSKPSFGLFRFAVFTGAYL